MTEQTLVAVALACAAGWVWCRPPPVAALRNRLGVSGPSPASAGSRLRSLAAGAVLPRLRPYRKHDIAGRRIATIELCTAVADELRAGRLPGDALLNAARDGELVAHAVAAARNGRPVAPALGSDAVRPGAEGLRLLAACWTVAEQHGTALAAALDRVADTLRAQEGARRRIEVELAGPKATARMLAALPVLGLLIGSLSGADPVGVLVGTPWGWALLASGLGLNLAGLTWVDRIARSAERAL